MLKDAPHVELTIPLEQGWWDSIGSVREECHRNLGTPLVHDEQDHEP